jgi:hypothetical protein
VASLRAGRTISPGSPAANRNGLTTKRKTRAAVPGSAPELTRSVPNKPLHRQSEKNKMPERPLQRSELAAGGREYKPALLYSPSRSASMLLKQTDRAALSEEAWAAKPQNS